MKNKFLFILFFSLFSLSLNPLKGGLKEAWEEKSPLAGKFFASGPRKEKKVAFSFDGGPTRISGEILPILIKTGVRATFFLEGKQIERFPAIARLISESGQEVANHTYSHPNFYRYRETDYREKLRKEIRTTNELIIRYCDCRPYFLRLPNGYLRKWVEDIAGEEGMLIVHWGFGADWKAMSAEELGNAYLDKLTPGMIFLFHDGGNYGQRTREILEELIEKIRKRGYKIVSVGNLLQTAAMQRVTRKEKE